LDALGKSNSSSDVLPSSRQSRVTSVFDFRAKATAFFQNLNNGPFSDSMSEKWAEDLHECERVTFYNTLNGDLFKG
jgi:hypothetical protein